MKYANDSNVVYELTQDGDTGEYGAVVWFGTTSKTGALRKLHKLAKALMNTSFKKIKKQKGSR